MATVAALTRIGAQSNDPDIQRILNDQLLLEEVFRKGADRIPYFPAETRRVILAACHQAAPDGMPDTDFRLMTPEQQDLIRLIASGKSSKDIANLHHGNSRRIDRWVTKTLHRLNLPNRAALVNYYRIAIARAEQG